MITGLTSTIREWEDLGWLNVEHKDLWQKALFLIRSRTAEMTVAKVKAHSGIHGNEEADRLAVMT